MRLLAPLIPLVFLLVQAAPVRAFWGPFYDELERDPRTPAFAQKREDELRWVVQDDVVDLAAVLTDPAFQAAHPLTTYVYADVLRVPAGFGELLSVQALVIVARRVEVGADAALYLDYVEDKTASVSLYVGEWSGRLDVVAFEDYAGEVAEVVSVGAGSPLEVIVGHDGARTVQLGSDEVPPEHYRDAGELGLALDRALLVSTALPTELNDERLRLLDWVLRMAKRAPVTRTGSRFGELATDAAAQLAYWHAAALGAHVPELDQDVYRDVANAYLDALDRYQTQYDRFVDRSLATDQRVRAAELMLEQAHAATERSSAYLDQAERGALAAVETVREGERRFARVRGDNELARISFEAGIEMWKRDQTLNAVIKGVEALISFGSIAVGAVAFRKVNPAELGALFDAVGDISSNTAETMKKLLDALAASQALTQGSAALGDAVTRGRLESLEGALRELDTLEGQLLFAGEEWTRFSIESRSVLQFAIDEGVAGAREYGVSLETLALSAQTLLSARREQARAQQELAQLVLARRYEVAFESQVSALVASLGRDRAAEQALIVLFARRMAELKRPVQLSLLNYAAAFTYWSLAPAEPPPSLFEDAAAFRSYLARLERDYQRALSASNVRRSAFRRRHSPCATRPPWPRSARAAS